MPRDACSLREHKLDHGYRTLTLGNRFLSVTLLPEKGADIYSLVYKPRRTDVLWKSPWGLNKPGTGVVSHGTSTETAWLEHYEGGWQLIFPNGGDECRYKGALLNFHGEASVLPWDYQVVRRSSSSVSVELTVQLYRSPFVVRRTVTVERSLAAVLLHETIENRAEEDMHYMWGQHPAFGAPCLTGGCRLQVPARTFTAHDAEISPFSRLAFPASTEPSTSAYFPLPQNA
jgi:galactose mutarotase-like enzyme